ncbi:type II secretion system protein [Spirochaetes bacterium]|uniref:Type II secretion system protein n=1 Tax=Candidatus Scatousia excrementipullorum TaxID=2840936 RepID=A0A9D9DQB7_9BACT|nr:type II secretion system protein [Candidatus Scatousia excrementipullorum]
MPEGFKKRKAAFTLAEVLITLGIIGVVAAMTLPTVITNVQKKVVENQLKVFNTTINNAFKMVQVEHGGSFQDWIKSGTSYSFVQMREWLDEYLFPYMKTQDVSDCQTEAVVGGYDNVQQGICFHMVNGGLIWMHIDGNGGDLIYFANGKMQTNPRNSFQFQFAKYNSDGNHSRKSLNFIEPYTFNWNGNEASLTSGGTWGCYKGCTNCAYCTKIIQLNNWEIPDDYPW